MKINLLKILCIKAKKVSHTFCGTPFTIVEYIPGELLERERWKIGKG